MVKMSELSKVHDSPESMVRLRRRRRAEFRLQVYGILAIVASGLALFALLWTVVGNALGAIEENYMTLQVPLTQEAIDPGATGDPDVIGKVDFGGFTKKLLREKFPYVKARKDKKDLYDLVSSGASFELRQKVVDNPGLIGQTIAFRFLASDVADLYLKGEYGRLQETAQTATLTIAPAEGGDMVEVTADQPIFAGTLALVGTELRHQAQLLRNQAALQDNGVQEFLRRQETATSEDDRAENAEQIAARTKKRDALLAEADAMVARADNPAGREELDQKMPSVLLKVGDGWLKMTAVDATGGLAQIVAPIGDVTRATGPEWHYYVNEMPEVSRKVSDNQIVWLEGLRHEGAISDNFNWRFFTSSDSREPELAGIWGAAVGSFWTMLVTFVVAFPIGVLSAIYLEEFARKNRLTDFVEVNINNLAAVPSIVFGLLGLAIFIGVFGVPRSAPLAGGIVLALMTLPTIIIASRAAIRAVPPSIRDAALGLGASKLQTAFHHVLPLAMPGVLTGTIIGMAQALGETAPLIMIGMVAFIVDVPHGITDSATVLPVQVFRWADFPERAFEAKTAAAICVLLVFLVLMNALAVFLRKKFERRW
jgi:phosphate transport system permease protein